MEVRTAVLGGGLTAFRAELPLGKALSAALTMDNGAQLFRRTGQPLSNVKRGLLLESCPANSTDPMTPKQRGEMAFGKRHLNLDMLQWPTIRVFDTNRKTLGAPAATSPGAFCPSGMLVIMPIRSESLEAEWGRGKTQCPVPPDSAFAAGGQMDRPSTYL